MKIVCQKENERGYKGPFIFIYKGIMLLQLRRKKKFSVYQLRL